MRHILGIIAPLVLLTACTPVTTFYKPGASLSLLAKDQTRCDVAALDKVPTALSKVQDPPTFIPSERVCDADGNCRVFPPEIIPGRIRTVDLNAELRGRVSNQCMESKGYTNVSLPLCPTGVTASGPTRVLPDLTPESCVILKNREIFAIVTR